MKDKIIVAYILYTLSSYATEGTTTIPPSELIIIGKDKYYFAFDEELKHPELSFPLITPKEPEPIEKEKEKISIKIEKEEEFTIKERPLAPIPSKTFPFLEISLGNYNFLSSSFLFAKEKKKKGGFLLIERERFGGFSWKDKDSFHHQNKDRIELFLGAPFDKGRITFPLSLFTQETFLPYEKRYEKRKGLYIGIGYETPSFNNFKFSGRISSEKKDAIKNRGFLTELSFDFPTKNRLNIEIENNTGFEDKYFFKISSVFFPTKKKIKEKDVLINLDVGLSFFRGDDSAMFQPEGEIELKSQLKDLTINLLVKNYIDVKPFSFLYFETPYSTVSTGIKPERVFKIEGGIRKERLNLKTFIALKNNSIEFYKKSPGLYAIRNAPPLFTYGISGNINYPLKNNIALEFSSSLIGLSKKINYLPNIEGEIALIYDGLFFITPKLIFKGSKKTDGERIKPLIILNIFSKKGLLDRYEVFLNIENMFNNKYLEMEDYPGKRFCISAGLRIRL